MERFRTPEHLKAQLTVVRWHLHAAASVDRRNARRHLDSAVLTYQGAVELLERLALPDGERAAMLIQLEELRELLRTAGESV